MDTADFRTILRNRVLEAFDNGARHFVFWGFNSQCIALVTELGQMGLLACISGIVDPDSRRQAFKSFPVPILPPEELSGLPMDTLVVVNDSRKEDILERFASVDSRLPTIIIAGIEHFGFDDQIFFELLESNPLKSKAGGYPAMLIHIYQSIRFLVASGKTGAIAEFGAYQCGTTVFIARLLAHLKRSERILAFDTFGPYPPRRHALDLFSSRKCECPNFDEVKTRCDVFGIEVVRGDICETVEAIRGIPLMFTFFDTDNYSPTRAALELCYEQTIPGGVLAFDHYYSEQWVSTLGERMAAKEFLRNRPVLNLHGTGVFLKC